MQLILNKKAVLLLCFTINILHFIECSTESHSDKVHAAAVHQSADAESLNASQNAAELKQDEKSEPAKNPRNVGGVIQHNFRSSYVGNRLNRRVATATAAPMAQKHQPIVAEVASSTTTSDNNSDHDDDDDNDAHIPVIKAKRKFDNDFSEEIKYNVGPGVNIGVEKEKELVSVYLDEDCLKDVFTGRGRKQDLITKILPLFILPFLIQSAVVPFLVSTLKLLLIKSIVVGKIAIFLLLLSAFKNHVKYGYEAGPAGFYPDGLPNRRSEAHLTGYRVEGRPATWIN